MSKHGWKITPDLVRRARARNLRLAMDERGVSVTEMAQHLGCDSAQVSHYRAGVYALPRPLRLRKMAEILGVPVEWLQAEDGQQGPVPDGDAMARLRTEVAALAERLNRIEARP